jgi:hypothetical protein
MAAPNMGTEGMRETPLLLHVALATVARADVLVS